MPKLLKVLSENVYYWRKKRGWTQQELADRAKVGLHIVQRMEKGETWPEIDNITSIASALKAEETDLFYPGVPPEIPPPIEPDPHQSLNLIRSLLDSIEKGDREAPLVQYFLVDTKKKKPVLS